MMTTTSMLMTMLTLMMTITCHGRHHLLYLPSFFAECLHAHVNEPTAYNPCPCMQSSLQHADSSSFRPLYKHFGISFISLRDCYQFEPLLVRYVSCLHLAIAVIIIPTTAVRHLAIVVIPSIQLPCSIFAV